MRPSPTCWNDWVSPGLVATTSSTALGVPHVLGLGYPEARARVDAALTARGLQAATLVHPQSSIGSDVHLGDGVVVTAGARITTNVVLGRHTHIGVGSVVSSRLSTR